MADESPASAAPPPARPSMLLIGACSLHELIGNLAGRLHKSQLWRRPTIALMAPALPDSAVGTLAAPPEVERYVRDDLRKVHLAAIAANGSDALVFEFIRDIATGVLRLGESWIANPSELIGLPGGGTIPSDPSGMLRMLGLESAPPMLSFRDDAFLETWREGSGGSARRCWSRGCGAVAGSSSTMRAIPAVPSGSRAPPGGTPGWSPG
ncbi:hypothetical protein JYK14_14425 [Siccirubricoccus sp. KC 17139]|uniref:Uncharacterized protein n=1 Tax=Siccirubricoccus soli TaxID=2899147 RepID=A0ABT1D5Z6_9PROT|nr:hypothetical protein [Siccirubricoccus soli]MCP2683486.1 hypothetical protein [Siccirubricoccus soli]